MWERKIYKRQVLIPLFKHLFDGKNINRALSIMYMYNHYDDFKHMHVFYDAVMTRLHILHSSLDIIRFEFKYNVLRLFARCFHVGCVVGADVCVSIWWKSNIKVQKIYFNKLSSLKCCRKFAVENASAFHLAHLKGSYTILRNKLFVSIINYQLNNIHARANC